MSKLQSQTWDQLCEQLEGQLSSRNRGRPACQLGEQLEGQLGDQLWSQLDNQLVEQLEDYE